MHIRILVRTRMRNTYREMARTKERRSGWTGFGCPEECRNPRGGFGVHEECRSTCEECRSLHMGFNLSGELNPISTAPCRLLQH